MFGSSGCSHCAAFYLPSLRQRGRHWAKPVPPEADGFMADDDPTFARQNFNAPKSKRKPIINTHRKMDNRASGFELAKWRASNHSRRLRNHRAHLKPMSSDTTVVLDESKIQAFHFPVLILLLQSAIIFQPRDDQRRQNAPVLALSGAS